MSLCNKNGVKDFRAFRFAAINLSGYGGDKFTSKTLLRIRVPLLDEQFDDFGLEVALDDDFAIFGRAAYAAAGFDEFGQGLEVVVGADEAADDGDGLSSAVVLLHLHA